MVSAPSGTTHAITDNINGHRLSNPVPIVTVGGGALPSINATAWPLGHNDTGYPMAGLPLHSPVWVGRLGVRVVNTATVNNVQTTGLPHYG